MPLVSGSLNIAWEINAAILSKGFYGHVLWLSFDIIIFALNLSGIRKAKNKAIYGIATLAMIGILAGIFRHSDGMLVSSFVIDMIIAAEYVIKAKSISKRGKVGIAVLKFLGDLCAWLFYMKASLFVSIAGLIVLLLNLFYVAYCLEEYSKNERRG